MVPTGRGPSGTFGGSATPAGAGNTCGPLDSGGDVGGGGGEPNTPDMNHYKQPVNPPPLAPKQLSSLSSNDSQKVKKKLDFEPESHNLSNSASSRPLPPPPPPSFSLPKLHEHLFGVKPRVSHGAEEDAMALMRVCAYKAEDFIHYVNNNSKTVSSIPKMWQ